VWGDSLLVTFVQFVQVMSKSIQSVQVTQVALQVTLATRTIGLQVGRVFPKFAEVVILLGGLFLS
jgi:hypothetical protein